MARMCADSTRDWSAGMAVFDISKPTEPRQIGFMPVDGAGLHRIWYVGGRWAYASAMMEGFSDYILVTIDMHDPTKPRDRRPLLAAGHESRGGREGRLAAGARPLRPAPCGRRRRHRLLRLARRLPGERRRADKANPKLIVHANWSPPFGGGTHNCLPLPDRNLLIVLDEAVLDNMEDGFKPIWVFDNQVKSNPISIATFPLPNDRDYIAVGGHFGPHNIHENRPGSFQSSTLIFATYQNAGVRVYDISDQFRPVEVGACVPPAPKKLVDPRPNRPVVLHSADVFVDKNGALLLHRLERRRALHHGVSWLIVDGPELVQAHPGAVRPRRPSTPMQPSATRQKQINGHKRT